MHQVHYHRLKNVTIKEATTFVDWLEKGVFDALQKKYLHMAHLELFEYDGPRIPSHPTCRVVLPSNGAGQLVETYTFTVTYGKKGPKLNLAQDLNTHHDILPIQSPDSFTEKTSTIIQNLIHMTNTLRPLPATCMISMKVSETTLCCLKPHALSTKVISLTFVLLFNTPANSSCIQRRHRTNMSPQDFKKVASKTSRGSLTSRSVLNPERSQLRSTT